MTFLPIVERELRVASRRRGTFMMRLQIAGAATVAFGVLACISAFDPTVAIGRNLFYTLSAICMLYCLVAGRVSTADCLSKEKRDGTFGLLFLTDLTGYDVVLGKMAATSLNGLYGLLAVFPLMAVPLLAGGMTGGEFWRMVAVLLTTFLFSTSIGIYASALCKEHERSMGANFGLMLLFAAAPPLLWAIISALGHNPFHPFSSPAAWFFSALASATGDFFLYPCPVYTYVHSFATQYRGAPEHFWRSLMLIFCWSLVLIRKASQIAPTSWQDKPMTPQTVKRMASQHRRRWWREGRAAAARAFRKRMLDIDAYLWLTARPHTKGRYVWLAMLGLGGLWLLTVHLIGHIDEASNLFYAFLLNGLLKFWMISEAGHQLAEDKRSGAFELLLSTPLTTGEILRGQWDALRRQFLRPVVVTVVVEVILMFTLVRNPHRDEVMTFRWLMFAGILMLVVDMLTIGWVAMASSLKEKTHSRATGKSTALILSLPWIIFGAVAYGTRLVVLFFFRDEWEPPLGYDIAWWLAIGIAIDAICWRKARRRMQTAFRPLALSATEGEAAAIALAKAAEKPKSRMPFRRVVRRAAIALIVLGLGVFLLNRALRVVPPPPLVVPLGQSNGPVRLFWGQRDISFILPDGTLWRWTRSNYGERATPSEPVQVGTNHDWASVSMGVQDGLGVRTDGTLWHWTNFQSEPVQLGTNRDWSEARIGNDFGIARKRDGTLWGWGKNDRGQLGLGVDAPKIGSIVTNRSSFFWKGGKPPRPTYQTNFVPVTHDITQIGDRHDWKVLGAASYGILAIRDDGTLWTWGLFNYFSAGVWSQSTNFVPTQACLESNWVGMSGGASFLLNGAGEWWSFWPPARLPGPDAPIAAVGQLLSASFKPVMGQVMTANWQPALFEVHPDGTLWRRISSWPMTSASLGPRQRIGTDSDWADVWGSFGSVIGQKSDGSLWIWGTDFRQLRHPDLGDRWKIGVQKIRHLLGGPNLWVGEYAFGGYQVQKDPVPLFKFVKPENR